MLFWNELIQAITMIPVFIVHSLQIHYFKFNAWIGMIHAIFSYMMHFNIWWQQQGEWPIWTTELYIADKCMILVVVWGFHFHFEPKSAKIMIIPCLLDMNQIILYQHQYTETKYAYFDIFLLTYMFIVCNSLIFLYTQKYKMFVCILLECLSIIGYGMKWDGLMHTCLTPGLLLWYENMKQYSKEKKNINKKEYEL